MAKVYWYSKTKDFLEGVRCGIEHANDSALDVERLVQSSNQEYPWLLVARDDDADVPVERYYENSQLVREVPLAPGSVDQGPTP